MDQNRIQVIADLFIRKIFNLMVRQLFEDGIHVCLFFFILVSKFRVSEMIKPPIIDQILLHLLNVEIYLVNIVIILG